MSDVIDVAVAGVLFDEANEVAVVLLGGPMVGDRVVPIAVGAAEAQAIAIGLTDVATPRPLTHDLLVRSVEAAGARIVRVDVVGLRGDTFLGELEIESTAGRVRVDARPSDGIAVAVRCDAPIGVDRALFDRASVAVTRERDDEVDPDEADRIMAEFRRFLEDAAPEDFGSPPGPEGDDPRP